MGRGNCQKRGWENSASGKESANSFNEDLTVRKAKKAVKRSITVLNGEKRGGERLGKETGKVRKGRMGAEKPIKRPQASSEQKNLEAFLTMRSTKEVWAYGLQEKESGLDSL